MSSMKGLVLMFLLICFQLDVVQGGGGNLKCFYEDLNFNPSAGSPLWTLWPSILLVILFLDRNGAEGNLERTFSALGGERLSFVSLDCSVVGCRGRNGGLQFI